MFAKLLNWFRSSNAGRNIRQVRKINLLLEHLEDRELMNADSMLGVVHNSTQWLINQNPDPAAEVQFSYGLPGDKPIVGKWTGGASYPGVFRAGGAGGLAQWALDTNYDPSFEKTYSFGFVTDTPVVGDWNGSGTDKIGVVRPGSDGLLHWYLDWNGDGNPNAEVVLEFGFNGDTPVVGDWNGDGKDHIGVVQKWPGTNELHWMLDTNSGMQPNGTVRVDPAAEYNIPYGLIGDTPVVGDWNGDGRTDIGVVRPIQGLEHWLLNSHWTYDPANAAQDQDIAFGLPGDQPVAGDWRFPSMSIQGVTSGQTSPVDFGNPDVGQSKVLSFHITNSGDAALTLQQPTMPAGFNLVSGFATTVAPGGSADFQVAVNTSAPGIYGGAITIDTNVPNANHFTFPVRASVGRPNMTVDGVSNGQANQIDYGSINEGAYVDKTFTLRNTGTRRVDISSITSSQSSFQILNAPTSVAPGATAALTVRLNGVTPGIPSGNITITSNDPIYPFTFNIPVKGKVLGSNITFSPFGGTIDFGSPVQSGAFPVKTFTIKNDGNINLTVNPPTLPVGFLVSRNNWTGTLTVAPGASYQFDVQLSTANPGSFAGNLSLSTNDFDAKVVSQPIKGVVLALQKIDVQGIVNGQATAINFGTIAVGQSAQETFHVTNQGDLRLTFTSVQVPTGYTIVKALPAYLDGKQSADLIVKLTGTVVGSFPGTIQINSNDTKASPFNIKVVGTVVGAPKIDVSVSGKHLSGTSGTVQYGAVYSNGAGATTQTLTIRNLGTSPLNLTWNTIPGFTILNPPATILPGGTVNVQVSINVSTLGPKSGTLILGSNDATEPQIVLNLSGEVFQPPSYVGGSPATTNNGTYTIYGSGTYYIEPANGSVAFGTAYIIRTSSGTVITINGTLSRVVFASSGVTVQLWTPNVTVVGTTNVIADYKTGLI